MAYLGTSKKIANHVAWYFGESLSAEVLKAIEKIVADRSGRKAPSRMPKERDKRKLINTERNAAIMRDRAAGMKYDELSDKYGISTTTIRDIVRGKQRS